MDTSMQGHAPLRDRSGSPTRDRAMKASLYSLQGHDPREEDQYERRRELELKREIDHKEEEIQNLAKTTDILRQRLDQAATNQPDRLPSHAQPNITLHQHKSPLRYKTDLGPPPHIREHLSNLQSDNASLMRRLNLVLQELDRVEKEKEDLQTQYETSLKRTGEAQRTINSEDKVDKMNRYMQDDLSYERDRNMKVKSKLKDEELQRNDFLHKLRTADDRAEANSMENDRLHTELNQKLNHIKDLEKDHYFHQEKLKQLNHQIDQLQYENREADLHGDDLQRLLSQLIQERNDLLNKLEQLTSKYDECVRDITIDRRNMEYQNTQHAKLLTSKIIFQQMQSIANRKMGEAMREMRNYCEFDHKCHMKLKIFSKTLEELGRFKMQRGLKMWFQQALKPLEVREQSELIAEKIDRENTKAWAFHSWFGLYRKRMDAYDSKTEAVRRVWLIREKDIQVETKRAFIIWKEDYQTFNKKKLRLRKLIYSKYYNKLQQAMNAWQNHSSNLENQIRMQLLAKEYTQQHFQTGTFHNFKMQVYENKRKRLNILFHCLKAWKDHIQYQRFIMGSNMAAMKFAQNNDTSIVKQCFDEMRKHKEESKYNKTKYLLEQVEQPAIAALTSEIAAKSQNTDSKVKSRFANIMKNQLSVQVAEYFNHWKKETDMYKVKLQSKIKEKILRFYKTQIRNAFEHWQQCKRQKDLNKQQMMIMGNQENQKDLEEQIRQTAATNKIEKDQEVQAQTRQLNKIHFKAFNRLKEQAMARWKDRCVKLNVMEDGASTVVKRLRTRLLRKAFDFYISGVKLRKQIDFDEERVAYYKRTLQERQCKKVFTAWCVFNHLHQKAKKYWNRVYLRMDRWMKQKAFKKWLDRGQAKFEQQMMQMQIEESGEVDTLNNEIGMISSNKQEVVVESKNTQQQLKRQADKSISNHWVRFFNSGQLRGFKKWKDVVTFEKHKETMLLKYVTHWKRYQFAHVKQCFKNWFHNCDINERKDQLKRAEMEVGDTQLQFEQQNKTFAAIQNKLNNEVAMISDLQRQYNHKLQKSIEMIVGNADKNHFMSKKRYILQQWREYVKAEKYFILSTVNVIQKSAWVEGFKAIKQRSNEVQRARQVDTVLNKFRLKFFLKVLGNSFSVWKSGNHASIDTTLKETMEAQQEAEENHSNEVTARKNWNMERNFNQISKQHLQNLFKAWHNTIQYIKFKNAKQDYAQDAERTFQRRRAMQKWALRTRKTNQLRAIVKKAKFKLNKQVIRNCFNALRHVNKTQSDLLKRLSNMASIHNHVAIQEAFLSIKSVAKSKQFAHQRQKERSSDLITFNLTNMLHRRMVSYFTHLKQKTIQEKKELHMRYYAINRAWNSRVRTYFQRWQHNSNKIEVVRESNEEGPVREQVFVATQQFRNLCHKMEDQGYTEEDIDQALEEGNNKSKEIMAKAVARFKCYNEEKYLLPKFYDDWKRVVKLRRIMRYWLDFAAKRADHVQSDVARAFDRWKRYFDRNEKLLVQMDKNAINRRALKNADKLASLADSIAERDQAIDHMQQQREALLDNYIKAQKMALKKLINNHIGAKRRALSIWHEQAASGRARMLEDEMKRNVALIAQLKDKLMGIERDNDSLANENDELRQFSLDGYEIARNVQALTAEREKLSVDLADKSQTIRKLLDENESLTGRLQTAQYEAQSLIKSTASKFPPPQEYY